MFTLAVIDDTVKVNPSQLNTHSVVSALTYNVNAKYANRVLPHVGLCVALFDFVDISEGNIRHGDGCTYYKIVVRLIVFRPFVGEVLLGKVKSADESGIRITMGFFDDIHVAWEGMPQPSVYDRSEASWFWVESAVEQDLTTYDAFSSAKEERFYIYKDEQVRFVVDSDEFNEPEPPGPETWKSSTTSAAVAATEPSVESARRTAPYKIKASMSATGTGMVSWWADSEAQTPDDEG